MNLLNTLAVAAVLTLSSVATQAGEFSLMLGSVSGNMSNNSTYDNYDITLQVDEFFVVHQANTVPSYREERVTSNRIASLNDEYVLVKNPMIEGMEGLSEQEYLEYVCGDNNYYEESAICEKEAVAYTDSFDFIGIEYNQVQFATFTNPMNERSYLLAYNWNVFTAEDENVYLKANIATGFVTGYSDSEMDILSAGDLTAYVAPSVSMGYKIDSSSSIGIDLNITPVKGGTVNTVALRYTFSF